MAPPCYADLGKQARDLFNKNYHFGVVKLDCKTTTKTGVEFNVSGTSLNDTGKVNASLETKYKLSDLGLTLKEKWNTDNTLATEISCDDQLARGLKLAFNANFAPQTGKKSGALKTAYKVDNIHVNSDVDLGIGGPIAHAGAVLHYQGWLAGAQMSYDANKSRLSKTNFAVGYQGGDFVLHTNVNDGQEFAGSLYQRVNDCLETGVQLSWTAGTNATRFGLGCVYQLDRETSVRAKVNNSGQVGLGFTHRLRPGISLTLSTMLDGKNFNQGGHKLGLGLDLSA
ncbi:hypothetical protein HPB47_002504 [Ixodes persulcatus]|uniref:Uncharacterized protein n=1 Tax=Ixodes persulcatus TaxID=34615 RepID=A0AC60PL01_IXOPE|nr:hypothetical protein HPB47_002504 [Ixodes persulcatus]